MLYATDKDALSFTELRSKKEFVEYVFNAMQQNQTRYIYNKKYGGLCVLTVRDGAYHDTALLDDDWYSYLVISDILYTQRGWI